MNIKGNPNLRKRIIDTFLAISIFAITVSASHPLLEEWGIMSWFSNAGSGARWWSNWWIDVTHGTPLRIFQLIGFIVGLQIAKINIFGIHISDPMGLSISLGIFSVVKYFVMIWAIKPLKLRDKVVRVFAMFAALPAIWTSTLFLQSLSSHVAILWFLIATGALLRMNSTRNWWMIFIFSVSFTFMMLTYEALVIVLITVPILQQFFNRSGTQQRKVLDRIRFPFVAAFACYAASIGYLAISVHSFGYEQQSLGPSPKLNKILENILKSPLRSYINTFHSIQYCILVATIMICLLVVRRNRKLIFLLVAILLAPLTSVIYFSYPQWLYDPNRVLLPVCFFILWSFVFYFAYLDDGKKNFLNLFLLILLVVGILFNTSQGFLRNARNYHYQEQVIKQFHSLTMGDKGKDYLFIDDEGTLADYYKFYGSTLEVALNYRSSSQITVKECSTRSAMEIWQNENVTRNINGYRGSHFPICDFKTLKGAPIIIYIRSSINGVALSRG